MNRAISTFRFLIAPAGLFLLAAIVSLPGSPNPMEGLIALVAAGSFFLWIRAAASIGSTEPNRILWARSITFSAAVVSIIAFSQITGLWLDADSPYDPSTTLGHRNFTAEFLIVAVPISFYLALQSKKRREHIAAGIIIILEILALLLISCRSSWVALAAAFIVCCMALLTGSVQVSRKYRAILAAVFLCFAVVLTANPSTRNRLASILEPGHGTNRFRILVWNSSLEMMKTHPIRGIGFGNFEVMYPLYRSSEEIRISGPDVFVSHAHNEYIEFALETGPFGLIAVGWFIFLFFRQSFQNSKTHAEFAAFSLAACGSITALLTNSLFTATLHNPVPLFLSAFLIGAVFSVSANPGGAPDRARRPSIWSGRIAALILSLLWIWMLRYTFLLSAGFVYDQSGKPGKAIDYYRVANRIWPADSLAAYRCSFNLLKLNRNAEAAEECRRVLFRHPEFQNGWYNLGISLDRMNRFEDAKSAYNHSLKLNPIHAPSWNNTGILKQRAGRSSEAESDFRTAIENDPRLFDAYHNITILYAGMGRLDDARRILETALDYSRSIFFNRSMTQHMSILGNMKVRAAAVLYENSNQTPWSDWVQIEFSARSGVKPRITNPSTDIQLEYDSVAKSALFRINFEKQAIKYLVEYQLKHKTDRFEIDLRRPEIAVLWNDYGVILENTGKTTDALNAYRHAAVLDSLNPKIQANIDRLDRFGVALHPKQ